MRLKLMVFFVLFMGLLSFVGIMHSHSAIAASASTCDSDANFLGFPTWYRGLTSGADCSIELNPSGNTKNDLSKIVWTIALNVVEIAVRLMAYVATAYILYGGFTYLTSNGSPDKAQKGLTLITNAVVGLIISIAAIAIVNQLFEIVAGGTANADTGIIEGLTVAQIIKSITTIVYTIAGSVAVIMFIAAGIRFITSSGNPERAQKARKTMINAAIGLIVIILAFTITSVILGYMA